MKPIVEGRHISKKFCRDYKRSIRYGFADILRTATLRELPQGLRKGEFWAVKDVSLDVFPGQALGIVGANGSGKTTLLRIVSGFLKPDRGTVVVRGRVSPIFARGAGFDPILSGYENMRLCLSMLGVEKQRIAQKIDPIVDFSELSDDALSAPVKTYSSGMLARLGFACVVNSDPSLLIIDEALAVGDMKFRTKCYRKLSELKESGTSFVMVSHSPNAIMQVCDQALYLKKGQLIYQGNVQEALKKYESDEQLRVVNKSSGTAESINRDTTQLEITQFSSERMDGSVLLAKTGQNLLMNVSFLAKKKLENIHLHLIIRSVQEPDINFIHQVKVLNDELLGQGKVQIMMPNLSLRPGTYVIKLFFTLENHMQYLDFIESTILRVENDTYFRGSHYQNTDVCVNGDFK